MRRFITVLFAVLLCLGCTGRNSAPSRLVGPALGTVCSVTVYSDDDDRLLPGAFSLIDRYEKLISRTIPESDIGKLNKGSGLGEVPVSPEVMELLKLSEKYRTLSDDRFDITISPLVDLWGIGTEHAGVPGKDEIEALLPLVDGSRVVLNEEKGTAYLPEKGMAVDLGGIAKGYIADRVTEYLEEQGAPGGIVDLGGNIRVFGKKPDGSLFRVGIQNPFEERGIYLGIVELEEGSFVTSGIYERFFEHENRHYHHILDVKTGYPVENELAGVAIVTGSSAAGDALSTSVFALGLEKGMKLVESIPGTEAVFITLNREIYITSGLSEIFYLKDSNFVLH